MLYTLLTVAAEPVEQNKAMNFEGILEAVNESWFGSLAEFIGNVATYWPAVVFVVVCAVLLLTFERRINRSNNILVETLSKNGKYIKGLFVELNDTKELLRYFTNDRKWKNRIVKDYNRLFDDEHGCLLETIYQKYDVHFSLSRNITADELYKEISKTIDLMKNIRSRKCEVPEEYESTAHLFEVYAYRYIENLEKLLVRSEFVRRSYIVMTGSAGNGKTNLLCNLTEMLVYSGKLCIFMNSKDIKSDINEYFKKKIVINERVGFKVYWKIQMFLCRMLRKKVYIILDAINENETMEFMESLPNFIDNMLKYQNVRVIVSCRSEYFDLKYRKYLVDEVASDVYCYDIMSETYSSVAKERMYRNYRSAFNFTGEVSQEAKDKLFQQLLLMRMFFEVHRDSKANIISLNKYEIFQKYIEVITGKEKRECNAFLDKVIAVMCSNKEYSSVRLSLLNEDNNLSEKVKEFMDESILLSRKLILHQNSIREKEDEEIYFVFDEMRDYCIAKYVLNKMCDSADMPVEDDIMTYMDSLIAEKAVCTEGVINYIYWYYKKQGDVTACKRILDRFMKQHDQSLESYGMHREKGLNSWGLRVIFENGDPLMVYEKEYVRFIVLENPGNELSRVFEFIILQELKNGSYTLELFFEILFSIHQTKQFCNVLKGTVASWYRDGITTKDFKRIDKELLRNNPEGCKRFRSYVFLVLHFLNWENKERTEDYFMHVCDEELIKSDLKRKIYFIEEGEDDESEI